MLSGRWPTNTVEWVRVLLLTVRIAAVPGMLPTTTVFRVQDNVDEIPDAIGMVMIEGTFHDDLQPNRFEVPPPGLFVLHPPSETTPTLSEVDEVASGCVFLPGLPYLGLSHRAGWVEADRDGTVITMRSKAPVDPKDDVDTAVLAMLL
jgi:hypothetical protein